MKKSILIVLVLLLLLTACQTAPADDDQTLSSTPSSSSTVTPPSSSAVPPISSVPATSVPVTTSPATSVPTTNPLEPDETGYSFIYDGNAPFIGIDPDCSDCTVGHLYWVDKTTEEVTAILEEPTFVQIQEGAYVYYVKSAEPTKIYRTPIWKFSQHEMIYESTYGKVCDMLIDTFSIQKELVLQFVADNKKFVVFELETGEVTLVMEQYYIKTALFDGRQSDTWEEQEMIFFYGMPTAEHELMDYKFYCANGEVKAFPDLGE